jgi:dihydroxy-acid dehydratase
MAYETGRAIVEMAYLDLRPSRILTRESFLDAIALLTAIGGSTNACVHLMAMARHAGVELTDDDWSVHGHRLPLLLDMQPAGRFLGERFHRAGGVPAVLWELLKAGKLHPDRITANGRTLAANLEGRQTSDREVIRRFDQPLKEHAGFVALKGNLFDFALMKTSVISEDFKARYMNGPAGPGVLEGRAVVFDGAEDYHARINDPALAIDEQCILVIRGCGPLGWPGSAEVVNMQPPDAMIRRGIRSLPTIGDGRQSGTSDSPSILHATPESARGGGLAWLRTGDRIRIDLNAGHCDALVPEEEIAARRKNLPPPVRESHTPWEEIFRATVGTLQDGACMEPALKYRGISRTPPRHNH